MRIIVCIKQVPDLSNISISRSQDMIFEKGACIMNPADECALELALSVKDKTPSEVVTLTLAAPAAGFGDENCINSIREYLAAGADRAYLLSDIAFGNGDPESSAVSLGEAIKKIGEFSLVITGAGSITGNRGQTGGRLAEYLGADYLINAKQLEYDKEKFSVEHIFDGETRREDIYPPAVISCAKDIKKLRIPAGLAIMKAAKKEIVRFSPQDLNLSEELVGERGAATRLVRTKLGKI